MVLESDSEDRPQEISLDELSQAFAEVIGRNPSGRDGKADAPQSSGGEPECLAESSAEDASDEAMIAFAEEPPDSAERIGDLAALPREEEQDDHVSPISILEAMLFVGDRGKSPLTCEKASEGMRGVRADEIPPLVDELNARYAAHDCPYRIEAQDGGYRLALQPEFHGIRNKFFGRIREARLSQAAIDVLAIVAYHQPLAADQITQVRGTSSNAILAQLVRRQLLRIDRASDASRHAEYRTTGRFLELFGLESLEDLPQTADIEAK
jgi:segregation and condensation protein B